MEQKRERVQVIDGIRGLSLLGILLANLLIFQYGIWGKEDIHFYQVSSFDHGVYYFIKLFIEGSFMPIFTFLFGYSMILMKESLERKDLKVKRHFLRRALFLILVGFLHQQFLWEGDILALYGIMTLLLLIFLNRKPKTILIWGVILFLLSGIMSFGSANDSEMVHPERLTEYNEKTLLVYGSGSYLEIMEHRLYEYPIEFDPAFVIVSMLTSPLISLPMFLFGMYAAKRKIFFYPEKEHKLYHYGMFLIPIGLVMKSCYYIFTDIGLMGILLSIGSDMLALGYIFLIAYVYRKFKFEKFFQIFESVGKLSMTNYLLQTVICTTIFYGYGLGFFGKLGVFMGLLLGLAVYSIQASLSYLYLTRFKIGPIEKLSRMWTYFSISGRPKLEKVVKETA